MASQLMASQPMATSTPIQKTSFILDLEGKNSKYQKYSKEIIDSPLYTPEEKEIFLRQVEITYEPKDIRPQSATNWIDQSVTVDFLSIIENSHNNFKKIGDGQYDCSTFNTETILEHLPDTLPENPMIYGQALKLDDSRRHNDNNHRTAFIIDFENKRVEYFNSFGDDDVAKVHLEKLTKALSDKYSTKNNKITFNYFHRTDKCSLQKDGYQCGAWAPKLILERIKQGKDFDPKTLEKFDIIDYRAQMFVDVLKFRFYREIGPKKLKEYVNKKYGLSANEALNLIPPFALSLYPEWCKTGKIPKRIEEHIEKEISKRK